VRAAQQNMLASMRETANAGSGDMNKKVAWAKQVLKFIERHQVSVHTPFSPLSTSAK
jgi:hypothetical protein